MGSYLELMMIKRRAGELPRISVSNLTDEVSSEVSAVLEALDDDAPVSAPAFAALREGEEDGVAIPVSIFQTIDFCDPVTMINGVQVNGSTYGYVQRTTAEIAEALNDGYEIELFLKH